MTRIWLQLRPLTCVWIALIAVMLAAIANRLWHGTQLESQLATPPKPFAVPRADIEPPGAAIELAALQDQALFHASRRYFVPPPPSATPAAPPQPEYRLAGVMVVPGKPPLALLLHNSTGASRKVKTGDELDGWSVQSVESQRVVLQFEQQTTEIVKSAGTPGGSLQVMPLTRGTQTASVGGTRMLGDGAALSRAAGQAAAPQSPGAEPRLYRPPPMYRPPQ